MAWGEFILAFAVFFASHSIPVRPPVKPWLQGVLGPGGFTLAYSALSVAILAWLIAAAGRAPYVELWAWAKWQSHLAVSLMLVVCLLAALGLGRPNPFSFGGARNEAFDAERPGIIGLTRHPLLLALGLWALAHIIPNGNLAHVLLFGCFCAFALLGRLLVDRRKRAEMGEDWARLVAEVARHRRFWPSGDWPALAARLAVGVAVYLALLMAHQPVIGVSPLAPG